jgi:hypothetical protein
MEELEAEMELLDVTLEEDQLKMEEMCNRLSLLSEMPMVSNRMSRRRHWRPWNSWALTNHSAMPQLPAYQRVNERKYLSPSPYRVDATYFSWMSRPTTSMFKACFSSVV